MRFSEEQLRKRELEDFSDVQGFEEYHSNKEMFFSFLLMLAFSFIIIVVTFSV